MIDFETLYHEPSNGIFPLSEHGAMNGFNDEQLLKSFYHSRGEPKEPPSHLCKSSEHPRYKDYGANAGAVLLYNAATKKPYNIPGNRNKEYHIMSDGFGRPNHSYGHSERILMRDILDDLIFSDLKSMNQQGYRYPEKSRLPPIPSLNGNDEVEVLQNLTERASEYRYYLDQKGLVVKMWSERPPCSEDLGGSNCKQFMKDICPEGSKYGHISKDYGSSSIAFTDFVKAYKVFRKKSKIGSAASCSAPNEPATDGGPEKKQKVK